MAIVSSNVVPVASGTVRICAQDAKSRHNKTNKTNKKQRNSKQSTVARVSHINSVAKLIPVKKHERRRKEG